MSWTVAERSAAADAVLTRAPVLPVLAIEHLEDAAAGARPGGQRPAGAGGHPAHRRRAAGHRRHRRAVPQARVGRRYRARCGPAGRRGAPAAPSPSPRLHAHALRRRRRAVPALPARRGQRQRDHAGTWSRVTAASSSSPRRGRRRGRPLKAFAGPFADVRFCPTGGIDAASARDYLAPANVLTVGGSWMVPAAALRAATSRRSPASRRTARGCATAVDAAARHALAAHPGHLCAD